MPERVEGPSENNDNRLPSAGEEGLTVGLIATFNFASCEVDDELHDVRVREDLQDFDYVPVKDGRYVVGLLERADSCPDAGSVRDAMLPLSESTLISSGASILSFVEAADEQRYRLVLAGSQIAGIVTLADLQKLAVRPALFLLVTHVELLMAQWLRSKDLPNSSLLSRLSPGRRAKVEDNWIGLKEENLALDKVTATEFCDKVDLLIKWGFPVDAKKKARSELKKLENLRNSVAHAGDYAYTVENALKTVAAVRIARDWIERLEADLSPSRAEEPGDERPGS